MFVIILLLTVVGVANGRLNDDSSAEEISKEMNFEMPAMPPPFMDRRPRPHIRIFTFKPDHFSTPRLPPFLHSASEGTKKRFHEIFSNQTLTFAEKKAQIDQLIEGENDAVKAEFAKFKKTMEERKQKIEQQHKEAVSKLSKEAQEADAKIIQLFKNESLTHSDRRQMMREIFEHLPKNVRDELNTLRPHNRFGGRFGKCCKGMRWPMRFGKFVKIDHFKGTNESPIKAIQPNAIPVIQPSVIPVIQPSEVPVVNATVAPATNATETSN